MLDSVMAHFKSFCAHVVRRMLSFACLFALYIKPMRAGLSLGKAVDVEHEAALDVRSLVLVNRIVLGELVEHLLYLGEHLYGSSLVGGSAELAYGITHGLCIVTVVETTSGSLADALYR